MTITDYTTFEDSLFRQLRMESKESFKTIELNKKLVEFYLNGEDNDIFIRRFIGGLNQVILSPEIKRFKLLEGVLRHRLMTQVLKEFKKSDILIQACRMSNRKAVEWLLTMGIDLGIQDEAGRTALMHAVEHGSLDFAVKKMVKGNGNSKFIQLVDYNGNNALFHAALCPENLKILLKSKISMDMNHLNNDNESLLLYCSRYNKMRSFELLTKYKCFDPNLNNCVGKTTAMYLVENARFKEIKSFIKDRKVDPNYRNKFGNCLVSVYIKKYYQQYIGNIGVTDIASNYNYVMTKNYGLTLRALVELKCDFNVSVDDYGNTPIMIFNMMKDNVSARYIRKFANINYSNDTGVNIYPINEKYAELIRQWITEVLFPNEVTEISLHYNTYRKTDPDSFGELMHRLNTCGLGTY